MTQKKPKINIILKAAISVTITMLLIIPTTSVSMNTIDTTTSYKFDKVLSLGKNGDIQGIQIEPSLYMQMPEDGCPPKLNDDVILTWWLPEDSRLPSLTQDDMGHTIATWTYEDPVYDESMIGIMYASDPSDQMDWFGTVSYLQSLSGTQWDTAWVEGPETNDYKGLFGVNFYLDLITSNNYTGVYIIEDITTDISDWTFYYFFSGSDRARKYICIEDDGWYYKPSADNSGPMFMQIIHVDDYGFDIPDCPLYDLYFFDEMTYSGFFDAQSHLLTAPASDPDIANLPDRFHLIWQYHNQTTDIDQIVWKKINPEIEPDIEYTPFQKYLEDGTNPAIAAYDPGYVAVVYMDQGAIKCAYSSDDGETWTTTTITDQGTYPDIYAAGEKLYSTYITNGNLFLVNSTDGGATWGTPTQINDVDGTVVEEENSVDIHKGGIIWIDTRQFGKKDVYFTDADITPNQFIRGDVKADGEITIGDAMHILKHLYVPGWPEPTCLDTVDVNDDGNITMDDAVYLMRHLYIPNAPQPPEPFPNCGPDPTHDDINCNGHPCNE